MQQTCRNPWCQSTFQITNDDLAFYDRMSPVFGGKRELIPPPTLCTNCRHQRRFAHRDERKLFHRRCSFTGESIISAYPEHVLFPVYRNDIWWSDRWDPCAYGRPYDAARPFFAQWKELSNAVPKMQFSEYNNENCLYGNRICNNRNCYMCFNYDGAEDCLYCEIGHGMRDCMDCTSSKECERCSDCLSCMRCYDSQSLWSCTNVSESIACFDCQGCRACVGCTGLRNREYCIENIPYPREEYDAKLQDLHLETYSGRTQFLERFFERKRATAIHRHATILGSEHCTGDAIFDSKNCLRCFETLRGEDLVDAINVDNVARDCRSANNINEHSELIYESMSTSQYHILFCLNTWESRSMLYCELCKNCEDCFGCVGLKHKQYCILNKQYTKEEYEKLATMMIEQMRTTHEYGEFFPAALSAIAYNTSQAQERFPITEHNALERGWPWWEEHEEMPDVARIVSAEDLPESIDDISDDVLQWAIECQSSKRPFRIVQKELAFYRTHHLPLPRLHPEIRYRERLHRMNPWKLWKRACEKCGKEMETTYAPERPERVVCEECYLEEVY